MPFTTVAIGASAGGVEALSRLLALIPADTGCCFVVVLHLSPSHRSLLASLLGRVTDMPVQQAEQGAALQSNHVYIIPPGHYVRVQGGHFALDEIDTHPPNPMAVDQLMMSLAADQHHNVVGIVLTGADGDGALGVKAIKSEGGMTIAQDPLSASHPSMPNAAIATGQVDRQLRIEDMPGALLAYIGGARRVDVARAAETEPDRLAAMLEIVRDRLRLDFSGYKTPMLLRRVRRRIGLCNADGMQGYLERLRDSPEESEALAADFLISVTEFFREPPAWQALADDVLPALVASVPDHEELRVWVPACASGEEAYSIAMLVTEALESAHRRVELRIFATDIDKHALEFARRGMYPREIEHRVGAARLQRFFRASEDGFQVNKLLRDRITFAVQNILADPPFAHLHMVSCRNLLIYMTPPLQQRVLQTFKFALRPDGLLVLGKSEAPGLRDMLFESVLPHSNIYRRIATPDTTKPRMSADSEIKGDDGKQPASPAGRRDAPGGGAQASSHGAAPAPVHQGSVQPECAGEGRSSPPVAQLPTSSAQEADVSAMTAGNGDGTAESLEVVLRRTRRELSIAIEELETANVELKLANEEAMSTNEELQSANEELATSKEELESVNEELLAVNQQLELKVGELESVNDDLGNLLSSTHIPTLFLDAGMHIKRYTPATTRLFQLIPTDLNRPLTDITSQVDVASLIDDARKVLDTLVPLEHETPSANGECYLRRTMPYRTRQDVIAGVVVTFTDVTKLHVARQGSSRFVALMKASSDAIVVLDLQGTILAWNQGAQALYGYQEHEVLQHNLLEMLPEAGRAVYQQEIARLKAGARPRVVETRRRHRDGSSLEISLSMSMIQGDDRQPEAVAAIERDISARALAEASLRESEQRFRVLADSASALIWMCDRRGTLHFANRAFCRFVGLSARRLAGRPLRDFLHAEDVAPFMQGLRSVHLVQGRFETNVRLQSHFGGSRWMKSVAIQRQEVHADLPDLVGTMVDIDDQIGAQHALQDAARRKDEFLAMLGHELRNPLVPIRNAAAVLERLVGSDQQLNWVHEVVVRQLGHVTRLVDDLQDISLITQGTVNLRLEPVDLVSCLRRASESVQTLMKRKRHSLQAHLPDRAVWTEGDSIRLAQVFENLLTNAAKYTDDGGHIEVELSTAGDMALVRVRDNGMGISARMKPRIFELFVQDERSVDRSQGGLGIGLALVRHLVELHGGSIDVYSEGIGKGSEFLLRLRLLPQDQTPVDIANAAHSAGPGGRVMVVEDDPDVGESMAVLLRLYGYQVERAVDLNSALLCARDFAPQAVLMDVAMPGADGYEVARRLRLLPSPQGEMVFIAVSGFGGTADVQRSADEDFADHLVKPVDPDELDAVLRRHLGLRSAHVDDERHGQPGGDLAAGEEGG